MLPSDHLLAELTEAVAETSRQPIAELLLQRGILRQTAKDLLLQRLRDSVTFTPEEEPIVLSNLWEGVPGDPPASLQGDWIASLPDLIQGPLRDRWNQIRLQKWMETTYRDRLEPYFLERRADLEQVVYGMIRLRNQGAAEELYLRLLDDAADFGTLARSHSLGEERYTRGLVGPMLISQPHATIRAVLEGLEQPRRGEGGVHQQGHARLTAQSADGGNVQHVETWVAHRLPKQQLGIGANR
jgi:hypothetical protein